MRALAGLVGVVCAVALVPDALTASAPDVSAAPTSRTPVADDEFLVAAVPPGETVEVHARPNGPVVLRVGDRTDFGSRRALPVVRTEGGGRWLAVHTPELGNARLGWVDARRDRLKLSRTRVKLEIDLSQREARVHVGGRLARRIRVGIGAPWTPTPIGRFAVTDKLPGVRYNRLYGCCILAFTARQPRLPVGWTGGDRVGIHGTLDPSSIGAAVTAGCLRATRTSLRYLMRVVPVGAPVVIHP